MLSYQSIYALMLLKRVLKLVLIFLIFFNTFFPFEPFLFRSFLKFAI